jgi:hypothetical protein
MVRTISSAQESTSEIVHWSSSETSSSIFFGTETWKILKSNSSVFLLSGWNEDGITSSGSTSSSSDFTDEKTHTTVLDSFLVKNIFTSEETEMGVSMKETESTSSRGGVDPA